MDSAFFCLFFLLLSGETPHKIDRSVKNLQKAIITKHGNKNIKILCTEIRAHEIMRITVIGV